MVLLDMATKTHKTWNSDDHDLLVELRTKMEGIEKAITDLNINTVSRINKLESEKMDRTEANRLQSEAMSVHQDHETRLRFIERYMWSAIAIVGLITFLLNYFHPFIKNCCG